MIRKGSAFVPDKNWKLACSSVQVEWTFDDSIWVLRLRQPSSQLLEAVADVMGQPLPQQPNSVAEGNPYIAWLSPSEWMIGGEGFDVRALSDALNGATAHLADVGAGRVQFHVTGEYARALLAKGTSLDLHPRQFGPGQCAQTLFAQTLAFIKPSGTPTGGFNIVADISYATHLQLWFSDASIEFSQKG